MYYEVIKNNGSLADCYLSKKAAKALALEIGGSFVPQYSNSIPSIVDNYMFHYDKFPFDVIDMLEEAALEIETKGLSQICDELRTKADELRKVLGVDDD